MLSKLSSKNIGILCVFLSAFLFGSFGTFSRLIGDSAGTFYPTWTRALLIVILLFPFLFYTKQITRITKTDKKWVAAYLALSILTQAPLFYAFNNMDIGSATLLFFVSMLLTNYIVGFTLLGEKMDWVKASSFVAAFLGLYTIFSFSIASFTILAAFMAILNGFAGGGQISVSKKFTGSYSALYITWLSWIIIVITNGLLSLAIGETQFLPSLDIYWILQLGYAVASIISFWLLIKGFRHVEASIGGLLGLLEIVFGLAFGALIFHEQLTEKTLLGALLIIFAAALPHLVHRIKEVRTRRQAKIQPSLKFAHLAPEIWNTLDTVKREGWVMRGIKDPETVQEHTLSLKQLALEISPSLAEFSEEQKQELLDMLEIHDWSEAITGDEVIYTFDKNEEKVLTQTKFEKEEATMKKICEPLGEIGKTIFDLWMRFETSDDAVSSLARQIDKYQAIEKAMEYQTSQNIPHFQGISLFDEFHDYSIKKVTHPVLLERLESLLKNNKAS
jgi:putative hydrolase of HD superfamily